TAMFLRPAVVVALLLVTGVGAAAAVGRGWIAEHLRAPARALAQPRAVVHPAAPPVTRARLAPPVEEPTPAVDEPAAPPVHAAARHATPHDDPSAVVQAIQALRT